MYQVLIIQLHYPLIARHHNQPATPGKIGESFATCATAAKQIVVILSAYDRTFSILKAPYLIAYATYVSATVHVRVTAQKTPDTEIMVRLQTCLRWLSLNQLTNPGVGNAKASLTNLMVRMGVECSDEQILSSHQDELGEQTMSQPSTVRSQSSLQLASSSSDTDFSGRKNPMTHNSIYSNYYAPFDMDMVLQRLASGESFDSDPASTTMSSNSSLAQLGSAAPFSALDLTQLDGFENGSLDPTGVLYGSASGEQVEPFTGPAAAGNVLPYSMEWQPNFKSHEHG